MQVCGFFDAIVTVGGREECEFVGGVAVGFCFWVQRVSGDDDGGGIGGGAAGLGYAAACGRGEGKERGEVFCGMFFDET